MTEGVQLVLDNESQHASRSGGHLDRDEDGRTPQTLNEWVKRAELDSGRHAATEMAEKMKALERESRELRQAKRNPAQDVGVFCDDGVRPSVEVGVDFIGEH